MSHVTTTTNQVQYVANIDADGHWHLEYAPAKLADGTVVTSLGGPMYSPVPSPFSDKARDLHRMVSIWKGDITKLKCDAIMNAANEPLGGCNIPNHCIDSAICLAAGSGLQAYCAKLGGCATGQAKISPAFELQHCRYVIHAVAPRVGSLVRLGTKHGPIVTTAPHPEALASCYTQTLDLAKQHKCRSVALCCIGTGLFGYEKQAACDLACHTVRSWLLRPENPGTLERIIFCVFLPEQERLYRSALSRWFPS